jgi:hypothetical protein
MSLGRNDLTPSRLPPMKTQQFGMTEHRFLPCCPGVGNRFPEKNWCWTGRCRAKQGDEGQGIVCFAASGGQMLRSGLPAVSIHGTQQRRKHNITLVTVFLKTGVCIVMHAQQSCAGRNKQSPARIRLNDNERSDYDLLRNIHALLTFVWYIRRIATKRVNPLGQERAFQP